MRTPPRLCIACRLHPCCFLDGNTSESLHAPKRTTTPRDFIFILSLAHSMPTVRTQTTNGCLDAICTHRARPEALYCLSLTSLLLSLWLCNFFQIKHTAVSKPSASELSPISTTRLLHDGYSFYLVSHLSALAPTSETFKPARPTLRLIEI